MKWRLISIVLTLKIHCKNSLLCFVCIGVFSMSLAQNSPNPDFEKIVNTALSKKQTSYRSLDSVSKDFSKDSLKMSLLLKQSQEKHPPAPARYASHTPAHTPPTPPAPPPPTPPHPPAPPPANH